MRQIFSSFSARLTFYILTLTTVIFACIAFVSGSYSRQREEKQAVQYTSELQQNIILKIDKELAEVETALKLTEGQVEDLTERPDSMMNIAARVLASNTMLKGVGIAFKPDFFKSKGRLFFEYAYKRGNSITTFHVPEDYGDYTVRNWYKQAMAKGYGFWTAPYLDYNNKQDLMTSYVWPCHDDDGNIYAVILADVALVDLTIDINKMRPYQNSYSFILTKEGQYLAHPDKSLILHGNIFDNAKKQDNKVFAEVGRRMTAGEQGTMTSDFGGTKVLICYAPLKRTGWSVCNVNSYRDVMKNLGTTTLTIAAIFLIGLTLLCICIRILVKYMSKSLKELTDVAYQIARGKFNVPLPEVQTKDDLRKLHDAFAHMQQSLKLYTKELETNARAKEKIESELSIARSIQMSLVPTNFSPFHDCDELELFASLKPAKEVGGDFYDFIIRDGKLTFAIGDVSGKGIPASLVMAIIRTLFRTISSTESSPAQIVSQLNNATTENNDTSMFVTFYAGELDLTSGELTFCNAGHNAPLIIGKNGDTVYQEVECNLPLGVIRDYEYINQTMMLPKGSAMLLYTDGLTEAENSDKEQFGEQRTLESAKALASQTAKGIIEGVTNELSGFVGDAEQSDDLTLLCFRINDNITNKTIMKELIITNNLEDSSKLVPFIDEVAEELGLESAMKNSLNLALEEATVNVIQYAYPEGVTKPISLKAKWTEDKKHVDFILKDCGVLFDPLQAETADISLDLDDRPIGGLGIFLVKEIMDNVTYRRLNGENILTMSKDL